MNGGGTTATTKLNSSISNNNYNDGITNQTTTTTKATGSRKRKRGLAPRKTQVPPSPSTQAALVKKAAAAAASPKLPSPAPPTTAPVPLQNGQHHHKATRKSAAASAAGKKEQLMAMAVAAAAPASCSMCGKDQPHELVDLSENVVMKRTLTASWMVQEQNLESTLTAVCVQCIYKINAFKDMKHSLKIRLRRLNNGQLRSAATVTAAAATQLNAEADGKVEQKLEDDEEKQELPDAEKKEDEQKDDLLETTPLPAVVAVVEQKTLPKSPPQTRRINNTSTSPNNCHTTEKTTTTITVSVEPLLNAAPQPEEVLPVAAPETLPAPTTFAAPSTAHNKSDVSSAEVHDRSITPPPYSPVQPQQQEQTPEALAELVAPAEPRVIALQLCEIASRHCSENKKTPPQSTQPASSPSSPNAAAQTQATQELPAADASLSLLAVDPNSPAELEVIHSPNPNHSMLEVFCEHSESALITESGGKINNYQRRSGSGPTRRLPPQQLTCAHCSRAYWRKDYYAKHLRRCGAQHRRAKSMAAMSTSSAKNLSPLVCLEDSEQAAQPRAEDTSKMTTTMQKQRIFHCSVCAVTVDSLTKLREHKRIHQARFYCSTCGSELTTQHAYDFHRIVCDAQQEALGNTVAPRMTRARSRAATQVNVGNRKQNRRDTRASEDTLQRNADAEGEDSADDDDDDDVNVDDDDDDNDDGVSQADTMYTKRMRFTGNWVEDHYSGQNDLPQSENIFFYDDDNQITTYKEYDLHLLDILKQQIRQNRFSCLTCQAVTKSLPTMMVHDYMDHLKRAFFYCNKCGCCFSDKVFLDYHLDRQNAGNFICFKCEELFHLQNQLDWHLIRHNKCVNYCCNYCKYEFLTESELLQHCNKSQHDPNGERRLIRIDRTMTLTSRASTPPPPDGVQRRRGYSVHILEWRLPRVPSKRPLVLPPDFRRKIGQVEFSNQQSPNCVGDGWVFN